MIMLTIKILNQSKTFLFYMLLLTTIIIISSCNPKLAKEHPQVAKGRTIYEKYCTECHGVNGKGVKAFQSYQTIDLTKILQRRGTDDFPIMEIARYIDGRQHTKETGARLMPMWGVDMVKLEHQYNPDTARTNMGAILSYLITLQEF
ncbi:MAG TPA: hypothetical protein DCX89_02840 [Saprospirales bacterium]|nr:hypothetical protein [Saprospirales bacterium]HAY70803.1 hypothetical protein [Saprospirales bacterium]